MTKQFQAADPHELRQRLSRQASLSCDTSSSTTINLPNINFPTLSSSFPKNADVMTKMDDVMKNGSQPVTTSTPMGTGPPSMTEDEVDKDFWNLVNLVVSIDLILVFFMPFSYTQVYFRPTYTIPPSPVEIEQAFVSNTCFVKQFSPLSFAVKKTLESFSIVRFLENDDVTNRKQYNDLINSYLWN